MVDFASKGTARGVKVDARQLMICGWRVKYPYELEHMRRSFLLCLVLLISDWPVPFCLPVANGQMKHLRLIVTSVPVCRSGVTPDYVTDVESPRLSTDRKSVV